MEQFKTNRLAKEKSPYLLEHAHNPVNWFGWGEEAHGKARNDGKPILLSIGYSTCHWCHRMREESFEDEKTAAYINKNFIPIKVDREERPEVDSYYMSAVQAMTGGGGWPLTVFLTPDLKPFYGGTYYPPTPRYGMPSFMQVLEFVSNLWKDKRGEVTANSEQVQKALTTKDAQSAELGKSVLDEGYTGLVSMFDPEHGGFGPAPKFPLPSSLSYLLRYHYRTGKELALKSVLKTLDAMAAGGIRDHIGGGFHRYSTDRVWLVPHFEKMLYDNALLAKVYTEAYQITKRPHYEAVVRETLGWIRREMTAPEGGFYSAQDADTKEGEGKYYTWTPDEIGKELGEESASNFNRTFGVTRTGNFEGRTILHFVSAYEDREIESDNLSESKKILYEVRLQRPRPATDTKVLTSWNGLAISALSLAGTSLKEEAFLQSARKAADFILKKNTKDGRLLRRYAGGEAALDGTLEDYSFFVQGLLDLFEATADPQWLGEAMRLTEIMVRDNEDNESGGFYFTIKAEPVRLKESYDGPTPSGNSVAAVNLIRLFELTGDDKFRKSAERALKFFGGEVEQRPSGHMFMLTALDMLLNGVKEIAITAPTMKSAAPMLAETNGRFMPDKALLVATKETYGELSRMSQLLDGRKIGSKARAYVCEKFVCKLPADTPEGLRDQLETGRD